MSKKIDEKTILKFFFEEPYREFHVRELAKLTKLTPTTISYYLSRFNGECYLNKKFERNHLLFSADTKSERFKIYKLFYNLEKINDSNLIKHIVDKLNYPNAIILFGSYAKAENTTESDIDIFVLSEMDKELNLSEYEKRMGCSIQVFKHNKKTFEELKNTNKELINNICNGITLYGFLELL